ncbi:MAG: zinc ABC transporter substrate-binding protein [Planctomycetota bacterium]
MSERQTSPGIRRTLVGLFVVFLAAISAGIYGCDSGSTESGAASSTWVITTGHIGDALARITDGTDIELKVFCGPGVDPHSFSASTADVQAMVDAEAIFYNGFHLEAKLHDLLHGDFVDKAFAMSAAFPTDARLDWVEDGEIDPEAPFDPHIWNHLPGWSKCIEGLVERACEIAPDHADDFRANGQKYIDEIMAAHQSATERFAAIPEQQRVIVSAHDAFNYFAQVYGFESKAVLGIGNDAEADVKTMREVAEFVSERKVPVIFLESITNPKVTEALQEACEARDWSVKIAEEPLYSDDLGSEPPQDTYLGAFESNVDLIVRSLQP